MPEACLPGIAASVDARQTLVGVSDAARDAPTCVDAVLRLAIDDEAVRQWLGEKGEPGLLVVAGKDEVLPCAQLHNVWTKALETRTADVYSALTVPLGYAVKRCAADMDGVLADAIVRLPATRGLIVAAIDPFAGYGNALHATCAALPEVAGGRDPAIVRERASDALSHACKSPT